MYSAMIHLPGNGYSLCVKGGSHSGSPVTIRHFVSVGRSDPADYGCLATCAAPFLLLVKVSGMCAKVSLILFCLGLANRIKRAPIGSADRFVVCRGATPDSQSSPD